MITIMRQEFFDFFVNRAGKRIDLEKGSTLFRQRDAVKSIFAIEKGLVELTRHQKDGRRVVLQRASAQAVIAEASLYSDRYHCDAIAGQDSCVVSIPRREFEHHLRCDERFSELWCGYLATEVQAARALIEILSRKTVSERLDGWLAWQDSEPVLKGQWKNVAAQIGVSPEALYRELAKRRLK